MDKITRDAEEIEQTITGYRDQTLRIKQQQEETEDLVRKAQVEIDRIIQVVHTIDQSWHFHPHNINSSKKSSILPFLFYKTEVFL